MGRSRIFCIVSFVVIAVFLSGGAWGKPECQAELYRNTMFTESQKNFSPYDQIYIVVDCQTVKAGEHVMLANWIHEKQGLVRYNSHAFNQAVDDRRTIYFWFKLSRRGPLASALLNKDFHEEHFGKWRVEIYLDDMPVLMRDFTIEP